MRVDRGARSAPSGGGRAGGGPGEPGKPGLWGVSRVPLAPCSFLVRQVRRGIRGRCCALSPVIGAAGPSLFSGGGRRGLGNLEPGPWFSGAGGGSGFPSAFPDWSLLLSVYSCSRAVVFLTSPSCLVEGVRSGTRRRRGASALAQAGGGTEPETRRTAPARGRCAVRPVCGSLCGCRVGLSGPRAPDIGIGLPSVTGNLTWYFLLPVLVFPGFRADFHDIIDGVS